MHLIRTRLAVTLIAAALYGGAPRAQEPPERPVFRSSVEMVSMAAVVRDRNGKVVRSLSRDDFEVFDAGSRRSIIDVRADASAPLSLAILVDGSGSMSVGSTLDAAQRAAGDILDALQPGRDEAALFTFDTRLIELHEFTNDFEPIRTRLEDLEAYGLTSLYDAIADTARRVSKFAARRRAIVVLTDGADTSSRLTAAQVSGLASSYDVPIYVFALHEQQLVDNGPLPDLARWSGGAYFPAGSRVLALSAVDQVASELRHQYLLAFEAAAAHGWRRVEIRTRRPGLTVRSRSWYRAGG